MDGTPEMAKQKEREAKRDVTGGEGGAEKAFSCVQGKQKTSSGGAGKKKTRRVTEEHGKGEGGGGHTGTELERWYATASVPQGEVRDTRAGLYTRTPKKNKSHTTAHRSYTHTHTQTNTRVKEKRAAFHV